MGLSGARLHAAQLLYRHLEQQREMAAGPMVVATSREEFLRTVTATGRGASDAGGEVVHVQSTGSENRVEIAGEPAEKSLHTVDQSVGGSTLSDYDALRERALECRLCSLCETRTNVVFSDGNPNARLVVVGEAPGQNEDRTGLPFVGAAGKLLDLLLASVDLSREDSVYICNVLKCRPPQNRNPLPEEIEACSPYLLRQLELVRPDAILAVGTFAGQLLTGADQALGRLRGTVHEYQGIPLVVTYHPAALLRNSSWTRSFWEDLQLLRGILDAG